ncbi:hypothetical protein LguiB_022026 [Lonicera macranthoides]
MEFRKISLSLLSFITLALVLPLYAQNAPQDYLNAHNTCRGQVSCIPALAPMVWNTTLETYAQNYANQRIGDCSLTHSGGPYGENLAKGSSGTFTGISAVNLWVAEKPNYDYASNTCATGKVCGHYTQVVWRSSISIGCARVQCTNTWWYVICSYAPPGNYVGQKPY